MADEDYLTIPSHISRTQLKRLFSKISVDHITGCWNWTAGLSREGYGKTNFRSEYMPPHRLLYAWLVEPLPRGRAKHIPQLDHLVCSNRRCCNPAHLKLVTVTENVLRGDGPCARNARKTHCRMGHPLSEYQGRRRCWICQKAAGAKRYRERITGSEAHALRERYKSNQHRRMNGPQREEFLAAKRAHYHATKVLKRPPHTGS